MLGYDELLLSDGTTTIDLLSLATQTGVHLMGYRPRASRQKGTRGVWSDPAIAPGRRPVAYYWDSVEEEMTFSIVGRTVVDLSGYASAIRNLLQAAQDYYTGRLPNAQPVYLIRRAEGETTREYAVVLAGTAPEDGTYPAAAMQYGTVSYEDWACTIVRGEHWRDTIPGENGPCVENAGYGCSLYHLVTEVGAETSVDCGSDGTLDDLTAVAITVEAWVKIEPGWGTVGMGDLGIASKFSGGTGWTLYASQARGLCALITYGGADAETYSGAGTVPADGTWHHYGFTFTEAADNFPILWLDGVQNTANTQAKGGVRDADAGHSLWLAAWDNGGTIEYMAGAMGWVRVSNSIRYATGGGPYDVPLRCTLPLDDANAMGLWIGYESLGYTIVDMGGNVNVNGSLREGGLLTGFLGIWGCDCLHGNYNPADLSIDYANCADDSIPVFMRNAQLPASLTDVYTWDASGTGWSANLVEEDAYNLLPVPMVGDIIYFGIRERSLYYGPFFNLVFDIASAGVYAGNWEFYDSTGPGWATLDTYVTECDGTDDLQSTGVVAVSWEISNGLWVPFAAAPAAAVTGYWIRFIVTGVTTANPPVQQNRPVYTTGWAHTEIQGTDPALTSVPGDVPALARYYGLWPTSGSVCVSTKFSMDRAIFGLRTASRGADFVAYLNVGNQHGDVGTTLSGQTPTGVESIVDAGTITTDSSRGNGLHLSCFDGGATGNWISFQTWRIYACVAPQWYGQYRVFARARCTALNGTSKIRLIRASRGATDYFPEYTFTSTADRVLIDFGLVHLPGYAPIHMSEPLYDYMYLRLQCSFTSAADYIRLYDICLIPVDEKVVEANVGSLSDVGPWSGTSEVLDIDSVRILRTSIRAVIRDAASGGVMASWQSICSGSAWFQANADQRVWMLSAYYDSANTVWVSNHEHLTRMRLYRAARYQSIRGGR